ncbi:response regulator transcription factor [Sphaerothrix gracilis]|uniref:response regulator transcription factor n=1 Tax=Sphaerothrix gracilis TaxID=3151835 RepID=UPI0031FBCDFB
MRILLVDDDQPLMQTLAESLIQQRYAVDIANNRETAEEFLALFSYDLLVLDVILPDGDGISFCQRLRQQDFEQPVLMLTARDDSGNKINALDAGADDYVVKPFDFEELCARIRALLRREIHTLPPVLRWQALQLNPNTYEVTYADQPLPLTPKEYALLELFLRNPSRVFSLNAIIESLWSFEDPPGEDAVRTHIKGVRQKLKATGAPKDLIETVYGLGYRLKPLNAPAQSPTPLRPTAAAAAMPKQETLAAVIKAWEQHRSVMQERLDCIEAAAIALKQGQLTQELQQAGYSDAHKLVGSLGSFGFPEGSRLARELEQLLLKQLSAQEALRVSALVQDLRQEMKKPSKYQMKSAAMAASPLLLIVSHEPESVQDWQVEALKLGMQAVVVPALTQTCLSSLQRSPDLILLNLIDHRAALAADDWDQLAAAQPSNVPILVRMNSETFSDRLKLVQQGVQSILPQTATASEIMAAARQALKEASGSAKILIVDDDSQQLDWLQTTLARWGFEISTLDDPDRLLQTLAADGPDLLVLDVEMPEINGLDLCQVLRADVRWQTLPILFLTVHEDAQTQGRAFSVGADDFVTKPVIAAELANRILNRLRRSHTH